MVTPTENKVSYNSGDFCRPASAQGHHERHTLTLLRGPFLIRSLQIKTDDMYSTHFFFVDAFLQQSTLYCYLGKCFSEFLIFAFDLHLFIVMD